MFFTNKQIQDYNLAGCNIEFFFEKHIPYDDIWDCETETSSFRTFLEKTEIRTSASVLDLGSTIS